MLPLILGVGAFLGGCAWLYEHEKGKGGTKHGLPSSLVPPGHPVAGLPSSGAGAPIGITPPGVSQPPGVVISPVPMQNVPDAVHDAAAKVLQFFGTMGVTSGVNTLVHAFQSAYNATGHGTALATDGKYGPKTQAALQSVVSPAIAPQASSAHPVAQPKPAPAPDPSMVGDIATAANALVAFGSKKGSFKEVTTFQAAWNAHPGNAPLVVDGKYGGNSQIALQAVLNWMATGGQAPPSAYGPTTKPVPTFTP